MKTLSNHWASIAGILQLPKENSGEKMVTNQIFKVNFNYLDLLKQVDKLSDEQKKSAQFINKEFEYLYLLINDENYSLDNICEYSHDYLNALIRWKKSIPKLLNLGPKAGSLGINWWGSLDNRAEELKWNSKIYTSELAIKYKLCPKEVTVVRSLDDIIAHLNKFPNFHTWLVKDDLEMSGRGNFIFDLASFDNPEILAMINTKINKSALVLAPFYERIIDLGFSFYASEGKLNLDFVTVNFNTVRGGFRGGQFIKENYAWLNQAKKQLSEGMSKIFAGDYQGRWQVDSFLYQSGDQIKWYPLVEVNARKTMGDVLFWLANQFKNKSTCWVFYPVKKIRNMPKQYIDWQQRLGQLAYNYDQHIGVFPTASITSKFASFALIADSTSQLQKLLDQLQAELCPELKTRFFTAIQEDIVIANGPSGD